MAHLKLEFNKLKILMRKSAKSDKIRKIMKNIKKLKKEKGSKQNDLWEELLQDIKLLKTFKPDYITDFLFKKIINLSRDLCANKKQNTLSDKPRELILLDQLSTGKFMQKDIENFKLTHPEDWLQILEFSQSLSKNKKIKLKNRNVNKDEKSVEQNITNTKSPSHIHNDPIFNQLPEKQVNKSKKIPDALLSNQTCIKSIDVKNLLDKGYIEVDIPSEDIPLLSHNNLDKNEIEDSFFADSTTEKKFIKIKYPTKNNQERIPAVNKGFEPIKLSTAFVNSLSHKPSNNHKLQKTVFNDKLNGKKTFPKKKVTQQNSKPFKHLKSAPSNFVKFKDKPKVIPSQSLPKDNLHPSWSAKKKLTKQLCVTDAKSNNKIVFSDSE